MKRVLIAINLLWLWNCSFAQQLPNLPIPLGAGSAEVWNNEIYHFGGSNNWSSSIIYSRVYKYNGTNWVHHDTIPDDNLWDVTSVLSGDFVYLLEGTPSGTGLNRRYNLLTGEWTYLSNSPNVEANFGLTAEVIDSVIYLFHPLGNVFAYHIPTDSWETRTPNSASSLYELSSIKYQNEIYIQGWEGNLFYKYNPSSDQWIRLADLTDTVYACAMGRVNNLVYCIGGNEQGNSGAEYNSILIYDIITNSWSTDLRQLSSKTHWPAAAAYRGGLYVVGGIDTAGEAVSSVEEIVPQGTARDVLVNLNNKWNMVSVPLVVGNFHSSTLFPGATANIYTYQNNAYAAESTLAVGPGYWVKYGVAATVPIVGRPVTADTIEVASGWNMIGSISTPVPVSQIVSVPGGMISSSFYGFNNFYQISDTIVPGRAYWVKVNQAGQLILSESSGTMAGQLVIVPTSEMPPSPPEVAGYATPGLPIAFRIEQNYPNPFNPGTTFRFALPVPSHVVMQVYDLLGRSVAIIMDEAVPAGIHSRTWHAPGTMPSGVYYYKFTAGSYIETMRLVLMK